MRGMAPISLQLHARYGTYKSPVACEVFSIPSFADHLVSMRLREYYSSTKCAAIVDSQGNGCVLPGDVSEDAQRSAANRSVS